ncbi:MAG TPA: glycosyltransferase [Candidatus Ozemobacteraceae bacterium]
MEPFAVVIPAVKKSVAFADDLIKKLDGITLIQRAIDKAKAIAPANAILVVTDSQEISLICERNAVSFTYDREMRLQSEDLIQDLKPVLRTMARRFQDLIVLSPYTPTLRPEVIRTGYRLFQQMEYDLLTTVREVHHRLYLEGNKQAESSQAVRNDGKYLVEVNGFLILRSKVVGSIPSRIGTYPVDDSIVEIRNYQDWWVCEKLLRRKRIVFRVIGNNDVGMGHIFRSLALAHEISNHEVIFVCDEESQLAVNVIAGSDYLILTFSGKTIERDIIALRPELVVNDILDTNAEYIRALQANGIKVVNFEDLGTGAACADITFNELYDRHQIAGRNIRWGHRYYFLRDEFLGARPIEFRDPPQNVLITCGGTDPNDLTRFALEQVLPICREHHLKIFVVVGEGYRHRKELEKLIFSTKHVEIEYSYATGVMSKYMERADLAVSSNGRTVYELGHMNIPAIVIAQNDREKTHAFSTLKNGFVNLGLFDPGKTGKQLKNHFRRLVSDAGWRRKLMENAKRFNFLKNKRKVVALIEGLLA